MGHTIRFRLGVFFTWFALATLAMTTGCNGEGRDTETVDVTDVTDPVDPPQPKVDPLQPEKEWTFLVYINGNNSLDAQGPFNINQMEQVGSSDDLNVVVEWASLAATSVERRYVEKDDDTRSVTSPIIETLPDLDMGDWHNLVDFVEWGVKRYPAKHYFVTVWNHGNGWRSNKDRSSFTRDISYDDKSNNRITTEQLGLAMAESARIIGHKVDVYGSDACLMAMPEVASEMSDSVEVFVGSEELEPAAGWPYQMLLRRWAARPRATAAEVATFLTEEYAKAYDGGVNGIEDVTLSAFDLSKLAAFEAATARLSDDIQGTGSQGRAAILSAAKNALNFDSADYVDFGDFLVQVERTGLISADTLGQARGALENLVIASHNTGPYDGVAQGASVWIPTRASTFDSNVKRYRGLRFDRASHWSDALDFMLE